MLSLYELTAFNTVVCRLKIKASSTRIRIFLKTHLFLSVFEKICVHTMSVFKKISVHTDTEESLTKSFCLLNWLCKTKLVTSSFSKRYVFARPHDNMKTEFSKISTLDTVFEKLRFHHRKLRLRVDGRPKRINKYAFSKISVYVWTGPKYKGVYYEFGCQKDQNHEVTQKWAKQRCTNKYKGVYHEFKC